MRFLFHSLKALGAGSAAALLLLAATSNQVALGAASTAPLASPYSSLVSPGQQAGGLIAEVNGQYPGPILMGLTLGSLNSLAVPVAPDYHTTDFSTFD